mgnify:CR=1 FL=1
MATFRQMRAARRRRFLIKSYAHVGRDPAWIARALHLSRAEVARILKLPLPAPGTKADRLHRERLAVRAVLRRLRRTPSLRTLIDCADWAGAPVGMVEEELDAWREGWKLRDLLADRQRLWREATILPRLRQLATDHGPLTAALLRRHHFPMDWIKKYYGSLSHFLHTHGLPYRAPPPRTYRADRRPPQQHPRLASPGTGDPGHRGTPPSVELPQ